MLNKFYDDFFTNYEDNLNSNSNSKAKVLGFQKNNLNDYENRLLKYKFQNSTIKQDKDDEDNSDNKYEQSFEDNLNMAWILDDDEEDNILPEYDHGNIIPILSKKKNSRESVIKEVSIIKEDSFLNEHSHSYSYSHSNTEIIPYVIKIQKCFRKYKRNKNIIKKTNMVNNDHINKDNLIKEEFIINNLEESNSNLYDDNNGNYDHFNKEDSLSSIQDLEYQF